MHNTRALTQNCVCKKRAKKRIMMLSRARPLALRTLSRQQRALSAAPQPVYEPHVARTSVQFEIRPPTLGEEQPDTASAAGYFKS